MANPRVTLRQKIQRRRPWLRKREDRPIFCRHSTYCDCFQSHEDGDGDDGCGDEVVENVLLKQTSARQNVKKDTGRSTVEKANAQHAKIIKSAQSEPIALYCIPQCKEAS